MKPELFKNLESETIKINGQDVEVKLRVLTLFDESYDSSLDDDITLEKLDRGDYQPMGVIVEATALGETESDSIWGCLIGSPQDVESTLDCYPDLKSNALDSLRIQIESQVEKFSKYTKRGPE